MSWSSIGVYLAALIWTRWSYISCRPEMTSILGRPHFQAGIWTGYIKTYCDCTHLLQQYSKCNWCHIRSKYSFLSQTNLFQIFIYFWVLVTTAKCYWCNYRQYLCCGQPGLGRHGWTGWSESSDPVYPSTPPWPRPRSGSDCIWQTRWCFQDNPGIKTMKLFSLLGQPNKME